MADNHSGHPIPRSTSPSPDKKAKKPLEDRVLEEALNQTGRELGQSIEERQQRMWIGVFVAGVAVAISLCLLAALWTFLNSIRKEGIESESVWQFAGIAFSATYAAVVALFFALIKGMFQAKKGDDVSFGTFDKIKSLLDKLRNK